MKNTLIIFQNNFKRFLHNKIKMLFFIVLPILVITLGIYANTFQKPSFRVNYADNHLLIKKRLSKIAGIQLSTNPPNSFTNADLLMGRYNLLIDNQQHFKVAYNNNTFNYPKLFSDLNRDTKPKTIQSYTKRIGLSPLEKSMTFLILLLFVTSTVNLSNLIHERKAGLYSRIVISPTKAKEYFLGNFLFNISVTSIQVLCAFIVIQVTNTEFSANFLLSGCLVTIFTSCIGIFLNSYFSNDLYANLSAAFLSFLFSLFGGTFIAYPNMPSLFQVLGRFSPVKWFINIINSPSLTNISLYTCFVLTASVFTFYAALLCSKKWRN